MPPAFQRFIDALDAYTTAWADAFDAADGCKQYPSNEKTGAAVDAYQQLRLKCDACFDAFKAVLPLVGSAVRIELLRLREELRRPNDAEDGTKMFDASRAATRIKEILDLELCEDVTRSALPGPPSGGASFKPTPLQRKILKIIHRWQLGRVPTGDGYPPRMGRESLGCGPAGVALIIIHFELHGHSQDPMEIRRSLVELLQREYVSTKVEHWEPPKWGWKRADGRWGEIRVLDEAAKKDMGADAAARVMEFWLDGELMRDGTPTFSTEDSHYKLTAKGLELMDVLEGGPASVSHGPESGGSPREKLESLGRRVAGFIRTDARREYLRDKALSWADDPNKPATGDLLPIGEKPPGYMAASHANALNRDLSEMGREHSRLDKIALVVAIHDVFGPPARHFVLTIKDSREDGGPRDTVLTVLCGIVRKLPETLARTEQWDPARGIAAETLAHLERFCHEVEANLDENVTIPVLADAMTHKSVPVSPAVASFTRNSSFTTAQLREMTGLRNTALNGYAKKAGVNTPGRGQRNFRYSGPDARNILGSIISNTSESALLAKCRAALANLEEITK